MGDAFGRAILDTLRGERTGRVEYRQAVESGDGPVDVGQSDEPEGARKDAAVERYFASPEEWPDREHALLDGLDGRILDLGCGAGRHALHLQDRPGISAVVAVDVSPRAVIAAWERGIERSVVAHPSALPFSDDALDHVVCLSSQLCSGRSLDDVAATLREAARVTRPSGTLVADCVDPRESDDWDWFGYADDPGRVSGGGRSTSRTRVTARESS